MRSQRKILSITALLSVMMAAATFTLAQRGQPHNPLEILKHALSEAGAPALTSDQETQLTTLITDFRNALPSEPDAALKAAHTAYDAAILAGDLAAAQQQVAIIPSRTPELNSARLQALATLQIEVLAVLKSGGQFEALKKKFGDDRVVGLLGPLGGPPFGGRPGFGPGGGTGFAPGQRRPGNAGN